jgi:hypothetical protein
VNAFAEHAFMIDSRGGIDDTGFVNHGLGADGSVSHYLAAFAQRRVSGHKGTRMNCDNRLKPMLFEEALDCKSGSSGTAANCRQAGDIIRSDRLSPMVESLFAMVDRDLRERRADFSIVVEQSN